MAQFETLFPGHYSGRATHIHIAAHFNGTINPNGTYTGGYVSHVGQLFFDQALIAQVDTAAPYTANTQPLTTNAQDGIFLQEAAIGDPVVEYSLLGDQIGLGVFGWIAFGIDLSANYTIRAAATLTENGGVANPNQGGPGGPGGGPGGPPPSGTGGWPPPFSTTRFPVPT